MRTPLCAPAHSNREAAQNAPALPIKFYREIIPRRGEPWWRRADRRNGFRLPVYAPVSTSDCSGRQAALADSRASVDS